MAKVRDFMTRDVVTVSPDLTLRDALELLAARHIGGAAVVGPTGQPIGVISAADLLAFQASAPVVPARGPDEAEPGTAESPGEWDEAEAAATYFTDLWTDVGADTSARFQEVAGPEWDLLEEHTVAEAMSRGVLSIQPDADIVDAARAMVRARVHRLLVVDAGRLVGITTSWDLIQGLASSKKNGREPSWTA